MAQWVLLDRIAMNRLAAIILTVLCLAAAWAEEKPEPLQSIISVRAVGRLIFEDAFNGHPLGALPAAFVFRRAGRTNETLTVPFELSGTAQVDVDYTRIPDVPGTINTGAVQTLIFAPGERLKYVTFAVALDDASERDEFVRVRILPPYPHGSIPFAPPGYRVGARGCATAWILDQDRCARAVPRPSGGVTCLEFRPFVLPPAFFTTVRCR